MAKELDGIQIGAGFSLQSTEPLDNRLQYLNLDDMKNMDESSLYDGILAFVLNTRKLYKFDSKNSIDSKTGKWREFDGGVTVIPNVEFDYTNLDGEILPLGGTKIMLSRVSSSTDDYFSLKYDEGYRFLVGNNYFARYNIPHNKCLIITETGVVLNTVGTVINVSNYEEFSTYLENTYSKGVVLDGLRPLELSTIKIGDSSYRIPGQRIVAGNNISISEDVVSVTGVLTQVSDFSSVTSGIYQYVGETTDDYIKGAIYEKTSTEVRILHPTSETNSGNDSNDSNDNNIFVYDNYNFLPVNAEIDDLAYVKTTETLASNLLAKTPKIKVLEQRISKLDYDVSGISISANSNTQIVALMRDGIIDIIIDPNGDNNYWRYIADTDPQSNYFLDLTSAEDTVADVLGKWALSEKERGPDGFTYGYTLRDTAPSFEWDEDTIRSQIEDQEKADILISLLVDIQANNLDVGNAILEDTKLNPAGLYIYDGNTWVTNSDDQIFRPASNATKVALGGIPKGYDFTDREYTINEVLNMILFS